jgi:hypothetical protein
MRETAKRRKNDGDGINRQVRQRRMRLRRTGGQAKAAPRQAAAIESGVEPPRSKAVSRHRTPRRRNPPRLSLRGPRSRSEVGQVPTEADAPSEDRRAGEGRAASSRGDRERRRAAAIQSGVEPPHSKAAQPAPIVTARTSAVAAKRDVVEAMFLPIGLCART